MSKGHHSFQDYFSTGIIFTSKGATDHIFRMKSIKVEPLKISIFVYSKVQKVGIKTTDLCIVLSIKNYSAQIQSFWFLTNQGKADSCLSQTISKYCSSKSTINRHLLLKDKRLSGFFPSSKMSPWKEKQTLEKQYLAVQHNSLS